MVREATHGVALRLTPRPNPINHPPIHPRHQGLTMSGLIGDLIEGIADFFIDIWMLRRHRAHRNRPENAYGKDATDVAVFNLWTLAISFFAMVAFIGLFFLMKLPLWISLVPVIAAMVYVGYRWYAMVRA
jgi:hypothetical protein